MKKNKLSNQKWYNNAVAVLIGVVSYVALTNLDTINVFLRNVGGYFAPIFFGGVIAYLVNPLATWLQKNWGCALQNTSMPRHSRSSRQQQTRLVSPAW